MNGRFVMPNPCYEEVEKSNTEWAIRFGLVNDIEKLNCIKCGLCSAYTYPKTPLKIIEIGANLISWLFLFDDKWGEPSRIDDFIRSNRVFENLFTKGLFSNEAKEFQLALMDIIDRA